MACLVMLVRRFGSRSREGLPLPLRSAGLRPSFCPAHLPRLLRSSCHSLLKRTSDICSNRRQNRLRKRWFSVTVSSLFRHRLHQGLSRNHLHSRLHRSASVPQFPTHIFQSFSLIISLLTCAIAHLNRRTHSLSSPYTHPSALFFVPQFSAFSLGIVIYYSPPPKKLAGPTLPI